MSQWGARAASNAVVPVFGMDKIAIFFLTEINILTHIPSPKTVRRYAFTYCKPNLVQTLDT